MAVGNGLHRSKRLSIAAVASTFDLALWYATAKVFWRLFTDLTSIVQIGYYIE